MALNETEVQRQIRHMMAFIDQEAKEKVEEIDAKAEEEFQIEKSRLVQTQRLKIMEFYAKKEKQIEQTKKIQDSKLKNALRLNVLKSRDIHIRTLLEEARERLVRVAETPDKYNRCLKGMIVQDLLPACREEYKQKTGMQCTIIVAEEYLPESSAGGVELFRKNGKVKVVNTLESRLDQISEQLMPQLRQILFGVNKNRKFTD